MPELTTDILQSLPPWALALAVAVLAMLVMLLLKRLILVRIGKLIEQTPFQIDTLLVHALRLPLTLLVICLGLLVYRLVLSQLGDEAGALSASVNQGLQLLLILAIVLFADRFLSGLLGNYAQRSSALANSRSIVQGISHGVIYGIGLLVLLGTMGISVTPIVASLGITSLAVALALQPTLENFFSGVQLVIDKPIRVGDFIELESGEQGFVDHIGWRSTWIRMLPNNTVIMPNSVLSQSKIINYFYPEKELSVPVEVGVHYSSDLEHVEQVTLEVAREILISHEWGVSDYDTFVVYTSFGDSSINFTVMLRAKEYFNRFKLRSAFIKALHKRFAEENITIPFPIRAINLDQEGAQLASVAPSGGQPD